MKKCTIASSIVLFVFLAGCESIPKNQAAAQSKETSKQTSARSINLVSAEGFPNGKLGKEDIEKILTGGTLFGLGSLTGDARVNYRYQLTFQREGVVLSGDRGTVGKWWVTRDIFYISIPGWKNSISVAAVFVADEKIEFRDPISNEPWLVQY